MKDQLEIPLIVIAEAIQKGRSGTGSGGGGGGWTNPGAKNGGNGGSGLIVVRYKIGQVTGTAKQLVVLLVSMAEKQFTPLQVRELLPIQLH